MADRPVSPRAAKGLPRLLFATARRLLRFAQRAKIVVARLYAQPAAEAAVVGLASRLAGSGA